MRLGTSLGVPVPADAVVLRPRPRARLRRLRRLRPAPEGVCRGGRPRPNSVRKSERRTNAADHAEVPGQERRRDLHEGGRGDGADRPEALPRLPEGRAARRPARSQDGRLGRVRGPRREVTVDLKFPMLIPGSMRQKVQEDIERKLDGLFPYAQEPCSLASRAGRRSRPTARSSAPPPRRSPGAGESPTPVAARGPRPGGASRTDPATMRALARPFNASGQSRTCMPAR